MMSKVIVLVFSLIGVFSISFSQVIQDGQCEDNVPLQPNFDIQRFLGTWEEYARTDNPNQQGECSAFQFTDTNGLEMSYSAVNNNFLEETTGTVTQEGDTARLIIATSSAQVPFEFSVLETLSNVYETFAITFSCRNIFNNQRMIHIWVIKRPGAIINSMAVLYINTQLTGAFGIQFSTLKTIDHEEATCNVLPVIEPGEPIVFPGQCNTSLPVVQDFDVDRFAGLWHQISSYETPNGNGGCARAEYSRGDNGVVNILNSQVVNQEVVTIDGVAALTGTDAKLTVLLNIPEAMPVPRELWILRSDYDNYAVAYTCVNEGVSNRRVYSWILSRSRRLSPSAQTDVDEAIRSYLDLNSVYYRTTDQSDEACFYYPEPSDEPVVFRGQCESVNVKPMEHFEADRYMGTWHNIERYPSRYQDGTCSNALYDLVDSQVTVVNSQVKNERLETVKGVGVPASDGSAKLVVTFPNPGSDESISTEYWILDTDYNNYALVYTCRNLNENDMQVNTWKLSKTKQLLPEYEQVINDFISPIPYLNNNYYKKEDQSETGCFYFPEPQDNVPVVFPGRCEETVTVVESFDFTQFLGTWYEIESYPKTERTGQCINHQFSSLDNTRLNLVSSSVADQFRGELNGVVSRSSGTDNSGRLTITITDANGQVKNIPFWVLSTVYDDYTLAYGCENIGDDFRAVWSWKLSRNRELSTAATTAISNAMATNIVLGEEYFEKTDHSNDACFYFPDLVPGEPVILLGQCDQSIVGVPNFNIVNYAGRWRLIDSYGADFQSGTCNVARYTQQTSNLLTITNSQVVNGQLTSISGTATVTSTDGSGRLTFNLGGESFEVIILATDYDSYSLGYGCVNLPDNQRRVYSWKMSRENTMSQDAINSINEVIDRIQVLNNRFYYRVNRTDSGCFYFPTPDPNASVKFRGQCDQNIPVVTDFKPEKYLGTWYDIESYPGDFQNGKCNTAIYTEHPEAGIDVDVYNTQVINEALFSIRGTAVQDPSTDGSAKLTVTFNIGGNVVTSNYWVVATDYESYALVYSCQPFDDEYVQVTSWKLSRTRQLEPAAKTKIDEVMSDIRALDQIYFIERDQSREACFYYPEPQPGVPVVFPGQCDESIEAVPDFNMNLFQDTWHEISTYPKANQDGQCISQQFAVNATNSMRLDSFSVLDLTQSTTEGHVTFASDDDLSGKLDINIWVNGEAQSIPYWILSTDYNNYALAYSCVNIDKDTRGVWSWKLSKTRQLSDESNAAINDAIAKVDVLRNDYYENIKQTDSACFHLPDITPGDNVVLPGQCDLSIEGMADFDISRYAGEWRLIENYGSRYQSGTCNVARYTQQASNVLAITNSQVVNGQLASISGTATVTSTDGSGRLTFSMRNREYTMYILETDYDSFALAYGCANSGDDQRRVTSWKFSRFNTLSPDATNRINEIINGIEVLHQPYYYHVDRTPYACFYFPEPDRHTPVRFRGQCDHQSVTVLPEFDIEKYMGVWYDIESYPVVFQNGECPNARYAALDSNTVSVYNTHVVGQSLSAINGLATVASTDGSAKLKVTFDGQNPDAASDYWVLSTDYDSYAFVYSCTNDGEDYMNVASWKLSRTRQLEPAAKTKIDEVMSDIRALDQIYFIERDQSREACFYYPEPEAGVPVVFPGQCDESIEAVPEFNMNLFQDTWHEISAYPKANQDGQCISQQFAVNATNSMRLDSFSVLDLTQSATEGHVTFASDDDLSGKLNINIWVNGEAQSIPYWILSTDYNNYALAYSCVNIDKDTRGVWSWKLSKTRQLSDESNAAINDAIAKVDVLRNDYYENIKQTDSACFHLPDITPGDNVVLPGQCDLSIAGMADFDISRYAGEWRLIENYGSRYQSGTCNVARYTQQASNVLAITNSQVVNGQLASISGTATVTSTDGSGRLTFSMRNREYTMYILETDYDSFALAYGCANSGDDQRRVTSWKFSRFNTLSPDATNRINEIINGIEVLHQPYYYHVDRTPYACFYFPEPDRHTPVRFRGQCDHQSVTVLPEFDIEKYMGVWYDIESYPVVFQNGECPNARYAALDSNTVSVYNTHVVGQSLSAINGLATVASTDGSAKLKVTFDGQNPDAASDYWVLSTDYDSYAFVYSCTNDGEDYMNVASWKLSRTRQLEPAAKTKIDEVMSDIRALDQIYFIERDQSREACFYYPEPEAGVPVVFPGQCDESIEAVPEFNMNLFQDTWHEISAYPKANQDGQCISQQFAVNATNSMRLDSFSVLDLTQSATEGHVTFASDDDLSGKLNINIWVNGEAQSIPYWILSTDYNNYALAYSCVNIDKDTRGVWSWKLSKTRQLSDESNAAINDAIAKVDVLRNDYYENIKQTDSACFHLPDITPGDNVVLPGQCDLSIAGMADFDISRYAGEWRLIENYGSRYQSGTCNVARYTQQASNVLAITNSQVVNGQLASISGTATVTSTDGSGRLTFSMRNREYTMYILETDYDSFALAYGCANSGDDQRRVTSWKFSRFNTLSPDATNRINEIINGIEVLHQPYYYHVDRSPYACFYFPEPDRHTPVRFRGQCDHQSVTVLPEFDIEKYMGVWYDIESYPVVFQNGECPNARYAALDSNTVSVYNTHVVGQSLSAINGLATVASTDGSAKLKVTFDGQNPDAASDYWVLSTDYDSYAFVYSCTNDGEDYMNVASWKLSRTRQLEPAAKTKIDEVMSDIRALDQIYFIERDQSREACFYYPEPEAGVPVVFPGQCDESIEAVPEFNMNLFQDTWHEISAYPKANQDGQCISQQFAVNATNSMRLDSFSVLDLTQSATEGHVTFASDDDLSGKLNINIWVNGEAQSIPYWILSTDYNNYALAYSCVNIDKDTRGVWSWKLSKTRQLSDESNAAINDAIAKVDVLRNDYYENIKQTDSACFHLPDITPGDNVVLPGQCDLSIEGMADFDISRYAGEWRLIENYGSRYQSGTCNVARYTQQASNVLAITNSQVVNGQLASISGTATVTSTDGSGRLTFSMRNREYTMYILETDYDSFALAYGCANSGDDQRRVTSWKFSRFNTLSPDATNRINEIINGIEVLHQPYYYHVDRTPYACFYFPEPDRHTPVRFRGQCDHQSVTVLPEFDIEKYMGVWYDIESYPVVFQNGECPNARYAALDSNTVSVYNTHVVGQSLSAINGLATVASTDGSAKLKVTFDGQNTDAASDYWVLSTDYDSYAFVYSCTNDGEDYMNVASWKLSRTRQLEPAAKTKIDEVMSDIRALDQIYFIERDQSREACFYYPEPQADVPVVFPGQCDESIEAVPEFNMNLFQDTWHEISAYPKANQDGQCISQQFAVNATNSMRLDSFSVLDLTQSATEGHVTFASDDDLSGKLNINIWVNGEAQSIPYWILSTDYNNYALAYSCVNIDKDTRGVWSWKLSKTRQLSDESNAAINDAIAKVDVLRNDYYENIQQTATACFHYPELGSTDPVVFPGQCNNNIPVVQNFDASRYQGRWRLLESYYSKFQEGACNAANYSVADDGSVIVVNSKVVDEELISVTGTAVPDDSGSGKLIVTFPNSAPTEYWILATDYESYALVYTCVDLPDDQRRVWSWKMSRSNSFSVVANDVINQIINNVDVLHARYYQPIDRTEVGCFYYPPPPTPESIFYSLKFPGQCDESIPVQQNFNAELYSGPWFDVESYPSNFQSGTCNTARYTSSPDGTQFTLQNTQVVDQLLQTVTGSAVPSTTDGSAKFDVTVTGGSGTAMKYWVLATDYLTYSLVYSCRNVDDEFREVYSWKLGREPAIPELAETIINDAIEKVQVLDKEYFITRTHTDEACFYYPDMDDGNVILAGQCLPDADVPAVQNFNPNEFSGIWYEISRYPSALQNGECTATEYALNSAGNNIFDVIQTSVIEEEELKTDTQASVASNGRGVISINVNGVPFRNVYILATEYTNYAVAYSCRDLDANRKQLYSWKLSRSRAGLSEAATSAINELISTNIDLHEAYYRKTGQDHASCFHYPEFDDPPRIELPGPCDESITGVSGFNMPDFLGTWYEVARYPQPAQTGQCNRIVYGPGDTTSVFNFVHRQVTDEALGEISGQAAVTRDDGQIEVTFNVGEETRTAKYYVLITDYNSYALLYSCVNIDNGERRRVGSWKLSKTTELSWQASAAMEDVITRTQGLRQQYYQDTSQNEAACFYYPEFVEPPPYIELPGLCDQSITGVSDFNVQSFLGKWFEVARYPEPAQTGQCNLAEFVAGSASGTFSIEASQVVDVSLSEITGEATITSSDGSGRLTVTYDGAEPYEYYVLTTDYTGFALVYTCINIPNLNRRRVFSWKLSRNTELSEAANNTVNEVIDTTQGLKQEYYRHTSHSHEACFHYPTQTGDRVVLPGQCDGDISAVESFNVARFANNSWYQIRRYDAVGGSSCVGTRLSFDDETGNIEVFNFEVIDEVLLTTEGSGRLNSSDGSGIVSLVLNESEDDENKETKIYILATDYDGYALAYSCKDINSNQREVGAWQLSRGRNLTEASNAAIIEIINERPELHEPYFNLISQHEECLEPSSAFFFKSSIILIFVCTVLHLMW